MVEFSRPVDLDTVSVGTIYVGPSVWAGFYPYPEDYRIHETWRWSYEGGGFIPAKTYRKRVIFDPLGRGLEPESQNPYGFFEDTEHGVRVNGIWVGGVRYGTIPTVRSLAGEPVREGVILRFRTGDSFAGPF